MYNLRPSFYLTSHIFMHYVPIIQKYIILSSIAVLIVTIKFNQTVCLTIVYRYLTNYFCSFCISLYFSTKSYLT